MTMKKAPQDIPLSTNKFYANLFLGSQGQGVWTHPYSITWSKGGGNAASWGLSVSHIDASQRAFGPPQPSIPGSPSQYFINPIGIQSIILSALELGTSTTLTTNNLLAFSVDAVLMPQRGSRSKIIFPMVQGMGFITGVYSDLQPAIQSSIFFRSVVSGGSPRPGVFKYLMTLEDNNSWLLYATSRDGRDPNFQLVANSLLQGPPNWSGTIQVAKNPSGSTGEGLYDGSAGVYPTAGNIAGSVSGKTAEYRLEWKKSGLSNGKDSPLLMYALPHHVNSFDKTTAAAQTAMRLQTTTKGLATAVVADAWTMIEPELSIDMSFAPWTPTVRSVNTLSTAAIQAINNIAPGEIGQDMDAQSNLDSMYFSGKALSKFAMLIYTVHDLTQQPALAAQGLIQLKTAFARFLTNKQIWPLVYDTAWRGVVSSGTYTT